MLGFLRGSRRWVAIASIFLVGLLVGAVACDSAVSGGVPPTTGILIRAETLTTGRGCGVGPTQVYKYAVVVFGYGGTGDQAVRASYTTPLAGNVFDCFVDATFIELAGFGSNQTYRLEVYAYNRATYDASAASIASAGTNIAALRATTPPPTWTTECTATQAAEVETLALCDPLSAGLGAFGQAPGKTQLTVATQSFRLPDGRVAVCAPTPSTPEGGTDAGDAGDAGRDAGNAADAGDAGPRDAGADAARDASSDAALDATADAGASDAGVSDAGVSFVAFKTVRLRPRVGSVIAAEPVDITCPAPYLQDVAAEPATYTIDVGLVDDRGAVIGQTACTATTEPGVISTAVCP